ncbi:hypothetical protein [Parafannyhessea umbonata]|uniref:Uncharacterized protein n=1 Tax=Parafannyhessea umbonata TaxID=604330 RepID=A0A6N7WVC1_9ACTN|nr:hypothetical protein [Parafannyhessea umbonata]MST60031.1 hypothetical protein [Parafannyhessea umbonata]
MSSDSLASELERRLRALWDDDEFVRSCIAECKNDRNISRMIGFMERAEECGDTVTSDDMCLLALVLRKESDGEPLPSEVDHY